MDFSGKQAPPEKPHRDKRPFAPAEDALLTELVAQLGDRAWGEIEARMPNRSARQCRERWNLYLNPAIANEHWTPDEDLMLMRLYAAVGPKWTLIAHNFPKRTPNNVKNRQKQIQRRAQRMTRLPPKEAPGLQFDAVLAAPQNASAQQERPFPGSGLD
jgi:hypothetical protein